MQKRSTGAPVSGSLLQEKALWFIPTINQDLNKESFKASSGWTLYKCTSNCTSKSSQSTAHVLCVVDFRCSVVIKFQSYGKFQNSGHPLVPHCPDKRGSTVPIYDYQNWTVNLHVATKSGPVAIYRDLNFLSHNVCLISAWIRPKCHDELGAII